LDTSCELTRQHSRASEPKQGFTRDHFDIDKKIPDVWGRSLPKLDNYQFVLLGGGVNPFAGKPLVVRAFLPDKLWKEKSGSKNNNGEDNK